MRDYSFGNFISTLRERKGLSQYQLVYLSTFQIRRCQNGKMENQNRQLIS